MPKEKLNNERTVRRGTEEELPDGSYTEGHVYDEMLPLISMRWTPGQHAQFGVRLDAAQVRRVLEKAEGEPYVEFFTEILDRREMNNVVRVVRRARNAVHGADE